MKSDDKQFPWRIFLSELAGTAALTTVGLSVVIIMFGAGSPLVKAIDDVDVQRAITGFLFGLTGASIALSVVGKESGAHINPIVTLAFLLFRKIDFKTSITYVAAQLAGAVLGSIPLLLWGEAGKSVAYGATLPGQGYSLQMVLVGEIVTTFIMVSLLIVFLGFKQLRSYTPAIFPVLYSIMVPLETALSGTSTNPARSFGPALVSAQWDGWWIYWVGPILGSVAACLICSFLAKRITVAKLYHFDSYTDALLRRNLIGH